MKKPESFDPRSHNTSEETLRRLRSALPECFTENTRFDLEKLRQFLGEAIDTGKERYGLSWPGKQEAIRVIQAPSTATLRPSHDGSIEFEKAENVFIEGDNLEVLKLLQKAYLNSVKLIYIDPPYNTGKEFIYPDDFSETLETYLAFTGQVDAQGRKFSTNTENEGRFHSKWLSMMYPRLFLARSLLRDDGIIAVSIDDNELPNLRHLLDEVFGQENFICNVIWQKVFSPKNSARHFSEDHDYVVIYAKDAETWKPRLLPRTDEANARYSNPDNDPRGPWTSGDLTARNFYSEGQYEVKSPSGKKFRATIGSYWRIKKSKFEQFDQEGRIYWGDGGDNMPRLKRYLSEVKQGVVPQTLWFYEDVGHTQEAKKELLEMVKFQETDNVVDSVKPTRLLRRLLQIATNPDTNDIVLDFFAGTGSTAHAVVDQNIADSGNRRFVLVQLPEPLPKPEKKLKSLSDITQARITAALGQEKKDQKSGLRTFTLDSTNLRMWAIDSNASPEQLKEHIQLHLDSLNPGRSDEDLLFELLLKSGFPLNVPLKREKISGKQVIAISDGALLICLEEKLEKSFFSAIAERRPERFVCRDSAFNGSDELKTNAALTLANAGVSKFQTI